MRRSIALLVLLASCTGGTPSVSPTGPGGSTPLAACRADGLISIGEKLPDCSFRSFDGSVLKLTSLNGKPAVLNFWASWCTFCIKEMPDFQAVSSELEDQITIVGFDLLGVEGETEVSARSFSKSRGVTYPLAFDDKGLLYAHFSVRPTLPTTIFVRANGTVAFRKFGPMDRTDLRDAIRDHLKV